MHPLLHDGTTRYDTNLSRMVRPHERAALGALIQIMLCWKEEGRKEKGRTTANASACGIIDRSRKFPEPERTNKERIGG
jgi:hypothetical protein